MGSHEPIVLCRVLICKDKSRLLRSWVFSFTQNVIAVFVGFISRKVEYK